MGSIKSTWWSVTAFNDEIKTMETTPYPSFVRKVLGGRERCPETGREHFQGAVQCWTQIRMKQLKSWLPTAHLEAARQVEALQKYAMKEETATGEKKVTENTLPHFSADQICEKIALAIISIKGQTDRQADSFWRGVKLLLAETPALAGQLMNPSLRNFFKNTESVWIERAYSITSPPDAATTVPTGSVVPAEECFCGKDECEACADREYSQHIVLNGTTEDLQVQESDEEVSETQSEDDLS